MKFDHIPPLISFCFFSLMGIVSYWYLSHTITGVLPQEYLDQFYFYGAIFIIPFIVWMGFTKSDKEWEEYHQQQKQLKVENDAIIKKYESMPDLENTNHA